MKKNSTLDEVMLNWSSKTPNKTSYLTRNLNNKDSFALEISLNSNFNTIKRKNISLMKTKSNHETRDNTSKSSIKYSLGYNPSRTQQNSNNIYRIMLDNVLRKNRTFNIKKDEPIYHVDKGKNEFKKKFEDIKNQIVMKKSYFITNNDYINDNINFKKHSNTTNFLNGSLKKHLYIKDNIDNIFSKREKNFFSRLKIKVQSDLFFREDSSRN